MMLNQNNVTVINKGGIGMNDSYKEGLESIKSEIPTSAKTDTIDLLYGIIFIALGIFMLYVGGTVLGFLLIVVGLVAVVTVVVSFFWKSPKVKVIQAIYCFLMALLFLVLAMLDLDRNFLNSRFVLLAITGYMAWVGFVHLKEYRKLSDIDRERHNNR